MRFNDTIICERAKDGGPRSRVDGFWFFRSKRWFTVALLRFNDGSREAFHSHAFGALSWVLWGRLVEEFQRAEWDRGWLHSSYGEKRYAPSALPIHTPRSRFHKVTSIGTSWVFTIRGPWADRWQERDEDGRMVTLTHNRVEVET